MSLKIGIGIKSSPPRSGNVDAFRLTVARYLDRAAEEAARAMREETPKAFSTLTQSVHVEKTGEYERLVAPGVNYAAAVAGGTGPAAGKERYFPDPKALEPWVKLRARITFTGAPGSAKRRGQEQEIRDRAWSLARFISVHGTKPNPFHIRTADRVRSRCIALLEQGVAEGLKAALGGAA